MQYQWITIYCIWINPHSQVSKKIEAHYWWTQSLSHKSSSLSSHYFVMFFSDQGLKLLFLYHRLVSLHQHTPNLIYWNTNAFNDFKKKIKLNDYVFLYSHLFVASAMEKENASPTNSIGQCECAVPLWYNILGKTSQKKTHFLNLDVVQIIPHQGGRSCAKARRAIAEKFGLRQKF